MDFKESTTGNLLIGAIVVARAVAEEADFVSNQVKMELHNTQDTP
jgi:hypothetical protein